MWNNHRNLLSKVDPKKAFNAWKVLKSYYHSRMSGEVHHRGMPISLSIEPTTSCNLRCPQCPSGLRSFSRPTGKLSETLFQKILDELQETLIYLTFYFQGEPYLHKTFLEMVQYASKKKIFTATSTNAHFLDDEISRRTVESGLDQIIISLDGLTQESYEKYRVGGKLEKVLEGMRNLVKWKKQLRSRTPFIQLQFIVFKHNQEQLPQLRQLARELGVDQLLLKTAQIYDHTNGSELIPTIQEYSRYRETEEQKFVIKNKLSNHCWKMWHSSVITWDGRVVPCCFDKDASHVLGNVSESSFLDIWTGKKYNLFRKSLLVSRSKIDICKNCTEGTKVWA